MLLYSVNKLDYEYVEEQNILKLKKSIMLTKDIN